MPIRVDLTIREVADHLGVSKSMVHKLTRTGQLDSYKVGRLVRITPAALEQFKQRGGTEEG